MNEKKRQFSAELARAIEKICDGDKAALGEFHLRERCLLEHVLGSADYLAPKRRGRKVARS